MIRNFENTQPRLGERVYVDEAAVVIGAVTLEDDVSVWPGAVLRGDVNSIHVGAGSNIQDGSVVHVTHDGPYTPGGVATVIGRNVTVGHKVLLHACTIGDECLIGMGAIVMDKVVIEAQVILAAGALVPPGKRLESGHLYVGSPAKKLRELTDKEKAHLQYSAQHYVRLKDRYRAA